MSVAVGMFAVAGCALVATVLTDVLWGLMLGIRAHLLPRLHFFAVDLKERYGSWAVVTGSTDGIGRAYAMELAKRGINIVLISRTQDKLTKIAAQIESLYGVKTKTIAIDYSKGQFVFDTIDKELKDIPVGILVNNVGKQYSYPMYLTEVPEQELWDIVNINIGAATLMTRLLLPQMKQRGRGAIVNVSSSSELQPLPLMTVYAASKVYLKSFSEALRVEYQGSGITIQHLSPLFINTKMNAFSYRLQTSSIFVPDAETYAQNAINTLGIVNHSTGYWAHGIQYFFTIVPPMWVRTYIGNHMNKVFRRDYLSTRSATLPVL
ncbi:hydroxysteroid dehydrogenase-like protein 1 [Homalodisca vitripennis]|uniref:Inactive hydroxysteroid dehydrogenase-like protein 1 n=2 Tax=Proconiini TaxID=565685 RepID=A0A1B6IV31_9HEMI|nr:hydroxysteroid dehydrogenase-like protein 1 [Homalodisca vitripennis]